MEKFVLAIDQGTTGSTVALVNERGSIAFKVNFEFEQIFPKPGWVEHNPEHIWQSVLKGIEDVFKKSNIKPQQLVSIGITNQRETVLGWDERDLSPVYNAIVWQCRRTTDLCQKLKTKGLEKIIKNKTGLVLDPYFSGTKMHWILKNSEKAKNSAKQKTLRFGNIDTYLVARLTNGESYKTDVSNASRTLLMNLKNGAWDRELLELFGVKKEMLPEICCSNARYGKTKGVPGLPDGIPICGIAGDQQAALFGQACFSPGEAKCTFGTGSFILLNTGNVPVKTKSGVLTTVAWQLEGQKELTYALEGGAFICGAAVQWLRDGLLFFKSSAEVESLARQAEDTGGVEFVPALTGLGAPYWNPNARGMWLGLTRGTTKAQMARATLEAMALQNADILVAMEKDFGKKLKKLRVDGGASANNLLMQMQANYLGQNVIRPKMIETTALGAAFLAGIGVGLWANMDEVKKVWAMDKEFEKSYTNDQRKKRLAKWQNAIKTVNYYSKFSN